VFADGAGTVDSGERFYKQGSCLEVQWYKWVRAAGESRGREPLERARGC
jgi:hypothetical protein